LLNKKVQQVSPLPGLLCVLFTHRLLLRDRGYIEAGESLNQNFPKEVELAVSSENLELSLIVEAL
jgi:hypothetical protein